MQDVVLSLAVIGVVVLLTGIGAYNGLASLRQDVRDAWGGMDGQLRRRYDLLAPLVTVVRATGEPNPPALAAALTAKNQAAVAFNPQQLSAAEVAVTAHLHELFEHPPESLVGNAGFVRCKGELAAVAASIDVSVRRYNDAVHAYNAALSSFPHDAVALAVGFKPQSEFELAAAV